ncbi:MAG TPA: hypothetical protein DIW20_06420 [Rhodospirillaceae bacterium]|nr:hypothetical protein [Rhodospirillaceae bacterium]
MQNLRDVSKSRPCCNYYCQAGISCACKLCNLCVNDVHYVNVLFKMQAWGDKKMKFCLNA